MKRELSSDIFQSCNTLLGEQVGDLGTILQSINSALSSEYNSEFPNGFMKAKYSEISSLLTDKKNSNIQNEITLGNKHSGFSSIDSNAATSLDTAMSDVMLMASTLENLCSGIGNSVLSIQKSGVSSEIILDNLPLERAEEIKNGNMFLSGDGKYIYYMGYAYEIYDPTANLYDPQPTISSPNYWTTVDSKSYDASEWDLSKYLESFGQYSGNNLDTGYSPVYNLPMLRYSFYQALAEAKINVRIDVHFEVNTGGGRRVTLGVYNPEIANFYENFDYGIPYSAYDNLKGAEVYVNLSGIKDYEKVTGNKAKSTNVYDTKYTLDERHKTESYQSYLTFDSNGNIQETYTVYSGDTKTLVVREGLLGYAGFIEKEVYKYDIKPEPEKVDPLYQEAISDAIKGGF